MASLKFKYTPGPVNPPLAAPDYHTCEIWKNAVRAPTLDSPPIAAATEYEIENPDPGTYTAIWFAWLNGVKSGGSTPKTYVVPPTGSNDIPTPIAQDPEYTP